MKPAESFCFRPHLSLSSPCLSVWPLYNFKFLNCLHHPFKSTCCRYEKKKNNYHNMQCRESAETDTAQRFKYLPCVHVNSWKQVLFMAHVQIWLTESHITITTPNVHADIHSARVPNMLLLLQNEVTAWFIKANKREPSLDILPMKPGITLAHLCL